jgi:hypothetical protein
MADEAMDSKFIKMHIFPGRWKRYQKWKYNISSPIHDYGKSPSRIIESLSLMAMIKCSLSLYQVEVIDLIFFELTPFKGSHTNIAYVAP